jgi:hypothetical protein
MDVLLPEKMQLLFKDITDEIIQYDNDTYGHSYRLVCFRVGTEIFNLLTDRFELTTLQIIVLYAYRWQIELLFRFLKRTMRGIHLVKNASNGVTIQFYMMLIMALLQLKLKQDILMQTEQNQKQSMDMDSNSNTKDSIERAQSLKERRSILYPDSTIKSEPIDGKNLTDRESNHPSVTSPYLSHPYQFFEMIGEKLKKYWKIGIHWLTALRLILHFPYDARAIEILESG